MEHRQEMQEESLLSTKMCIRDSLYKLAEETRKLEELCKQIIELTKRYEKEYLTKKE